MQVIDDDAVPALPATPLLLAAFASAGAGFVHAAAAGSHNGERVLAVLFALAATVQLGWAALAMARPARLVAGLGITTNLGFVVVWLLTRTVGISFVEPLSTVDPVGFQDALAAALATTAAVLAAWSLATEAPPVWMHRSSVATVAALVVIAATLPAMAAGHEHDHDDEATPELAASNASVTDDDSDTDLEPADPAGGGPIDPEPTDQAADVPIGGADHDHDDGPITSLYDPRVTPDQRGAAQSLIDRTRTGMEAYPDVDSVVGAGYVSIGDGITGFEHFINIGHIADGRELDPDRIESIVARVNADGTKDVVSAMYLMGPGSTMDDVPEIAGALTTWHDHQDLCWEGARVVGRVGSDGSCARGTFRGTSPMLHVWLEPHPCGPFAGLEGHGGGCGHEH